MKLSKLLQLGEKVGSSTFNSPFAFMAALSQLLLSSFLHFISGDSVLHLTFTSSSLDFPVLYNLL